MVQSSRSKPRLHTDVSMETQLKKNRTPMTLFRCFFLCVFFCCFVVVFLLCFLFFFFLGGGGRQDLFMKFTSFDYWQIKFIDRREFMIKKTQTRFTGCTFQTKKIIWRLAVSPIFILQGLLLVNLHTDPPSSFFPGATFSCKGRIVCKIFLFNIIMYSWNSINKFLSPKRTTKRFYSGFF